MTDREFSQFDDPANGLNPFTPLEPAAKPLIGWKLYARNFLSVVLVFMRIPALLLVVFVDLLLVVHKYFFIIPYLVRKAEINFDNLCSFMFLKCSSFNSFSEEISPKDKEFDFTKFQKKELKFTFKPADLIIANQTCYADWFWIRKQYCPVFTKAVIIEKDNKRKVGFKPLSILEFYSHAFGIVFPQILKEETDDIFYSVEDLMTSQKFLCNNSKRPVCIFPELSKTNGLGILNIEADIIAMIVEAAKNKEIKITAIRFDHKFKYFSSFNSYDEVGLNLLWGQLKQFTNKYIIQYCQDAGEQITQNKTIDEQHDYIQKLLMIRRKEQHMRNSNWQNHQEFLDHWNQRKGVVTHDKVD